MPRGVKNNVNIVNTLLLVFNVTLGLVVIYFLNDRDIMSVLGMTKKDVVLGNMLELKDNVYDGKIKLAVRESSLCFGIWKDAELKDDIMIVFNEGDAVKVVNFLDRRIDMYCKGEYLDHIHGWCNWKTRFLGGGKEMCDHLVDILDETSDCCGTPTVDGCLIIKGGNHKDSNLYVVVSRKGEQPFFYDRWSVIDRIYPSQQVKEIIKGNERFRD